MSANIEKLKAQYVLAKKKYEVGKPVMSDAEFDKMEDRIRKLDPNWSELAKTGTKLKKFKAKLDHLMPSLSKIYPEHYDKWIKKWTVKKTIVADKLDGSSVQLTYDNGVPVRLVTRGDGTVGGDISFLLPYINIPSKISTKKRTTFRMEAVMARKTFVKYAKVYDNPRNLVAGILNRALTNGQKPDPAIKHVDFVVLGVFDMEMLDGLDWATYSKFRVVNYDICATKELTVDDLSAYLEERRSRSPYEMDGLVLVGTDQVFQYESNDRPKWTTAFKLNADMESAQTAKVADIIWQTSRARRLIPKIEIEPLKMGGVTVKHATVHNAQWMIDRQIGPGAKIKIVRSGDVIPKIIGVVKPAKKLKLPEVDYTLVGVHFIANDHSAESETKNIARFLAQCGVENIALKTVQVMYTKGSTNSRFNSIEAWVTFATVPRVQAIKLLRHVYEFGPKKSIQIYDELQKLQRIDIVNAMVGTGVFAAGIGSRRLVQIQKHFKLKDFLKQDDLTIHRNLSTIKGFGDKIIAEFISGLAQYKKLHRVLIKKVEVFESKPKKAKAKTGKFTGMAATWTGYRSKEQEQYWTDNGGTIVPFGSKTTHLFYKEGGKKSAKIEKAGDRAMVWSYS